MKTESKEFKDLPDNYKDESDLGDEFNEENKIDINHQLYRVEHEIHAFFGWTLFVELKFKNIKQVFEKILADNHNLQMEVADNRLIIKKLKAENEELKSFFIL